MRALFYFWTPTVQQLGLHTVCIYFRVETDASCLPPCCNQRKQEARSAAVVRIDGLPEWKENPPSSNMSRWFFQHNVRMYDVTAS